MTGVVSASLAELLTVPRLRAKARLREIVRDHDDSNFDLRTGMLALAG
jgi:hypothetical protein